MVNIKADFLSLAEMERHPITAGRERERVCVRLPRSLVISMFAAPLKKIESKTIVVVLMIALKKPN